MIRTTLIIESIYGSELARYSADGDVSLITCVLPGLGDSAWTVLADEIRRWGVPDNTAISVGPLLRFTMRRDEVEG